MKTTTAVALLGWLSFSQLLQAEPASGSTKLLQAIHAGDHAGIRAELKDNTSVAVRDDSGNTPLMAAALNGDTADLELLLKAGAEVNATNQAGVTALMRAATFEEKPRLLVAKGADVKARSQLGNTALIQAARKEGNSRTVKLLLDHGSDPNVTNVFGATALMAAAAAGDIDSVRLLIDHGADVNAKPNMDANGFIWGGGRTALIWAAFLGNEPLLKLLLERGAKVNDFVVVGGALAQAAWGGHAGAARVLLDAGAQVDQRDFIANYTPLHWAASSERSSSALTDLLLARGADANAEGGQPVDNFLGSTQTPLSLARKRGDTPIVQALLKAGAKNAPSPTRSAKATDQPSGASGDRTVAGAIQRAIPPLTKTTEESVSTYLRHASRQDCVACHQQQLPLAAISLAHSRHFATDREATRHQLGLLKKDLSVGHLQQGGKHHTFLEVDLQATFHPEATIYAGYAALALRLEHEPPSTTTDAVVHQLATIQHADGHWSWNLPRPPIQASEIGATAQAVYTIKSYGIPARRREMESSLQRARTWLSQARVESNEERTHQLLGLAWAGEKPGALKKLADELIHQQRADGGWGQLAGLDSDSYGTGQSLYALMEGAKISAGHPAVRRGLDFLLRTQLADGTWHVRTRAHPFQPPMDSGFPHGKDGWISAAGTSWAVMALATSLDPAQVPSAKTALAKTTAESAVVSPGIPPQTSSRQDAAAPGPVEFTRDIQPLLERSCVACHSGERAKGGFQVTARTVLLQGGKRGEPAVVPGKPDASPLLRLVQDQVEDLEMPPVAKRGKFPALTKDEIAKLSGWIAQGANWPQGATVHAPGK
jgi:ankyrin repeat protein/mono/diheme cytochrome c family protein